MTKRILSLALVGLFISCNRAPKTEETVVAENPYAITCDGIGAVKLSHSHAQLVEQLGAEKLTDSTYHIGGVDYKATYINLGEADEMIVRWVEQEAPFTNIKQLLITNPQSPYATENGIRVGTTLNDLRTANNFMPISMTSFYASIDGYAHTLGFNGGDLELNYPCLSFSLDITKQHGVDVAMINEVKTMGEVKSSHAIFGFLDVEVVGVQVNAK